MGIALIVMILVASGLIGMVLDIGLKIRVPALYWAIGALGGAGSLLPTLLAS